MGDIVVRVFVRHPDTVGVSFVICYFSGYYLIHRCLMQDEKSKRALLGCSQPRSAFEKVMSTIGAQDSNLAGLQCENGHDFLQVYGRMASALFNVFTSNYAAEMNSAVHSSKRGVTGQVSTREQSRDKIRKLNSEKK